MLKADKCEKTVMLMFGLILLVIGFEIINRKQLLDVIYLVIMVVGFVNYLYVKYKK